MVDHTQAVAGFAFPWAFVVRKVFGRNVSSTYFVRVLSTQPYFPSSISGLVLPICR